jgi:hypothetical protein
MKKLRWVLFGVLESLWGCRPHISACVIWSFLWLHKYREYFISWKWKQLVLKKLVLPWNQIIPYFCIDMSLLNVAMFKTSIWNSRHGDLIGWSYSYSAICKIEGGLLISHAPWSLSILCVPMSFLYFSVFNAKYSVILHICTSNSIFLLRCRLLIKSDKHMRRNVCSCGTKTPKVQSCVVLKKLGQMWETCTQGSGFLYEQQNQYLIEYKNYGMRNCNRNWSSCCTGKLVLLFACRIDLVLLTWYLCFPCSMAALQELGKWWWIHMKIRDR